MPAVRAALTDGLIDNLEWLSAEAAAVALYEIASVLPQGLEKREVGRRVAAYTYDGTADTFAAVGTRMALGSGKGLAGPPVRARVALALELPSGVSSRVDALALALASRRDLVKGWIARPSRGSLPARRLAGRLIERAAGEAARLAAQGDEHAPRVFRGEALTKAYQDLLWDREPLVWKHGAVARGLLAGAMPELANEIETHLGPELSPTQWRRAATSLGASIGNDPARVIKRVHELLASKILEIDHGVASCLVSGLAHGAKMEPEAAEELLSAIVVREGSSIAEAFEEGAREEPGWYKSRPCLLLRRDLALHLQLLSVRADDGSASLAAELLRDLDPSARPERPTRHGVEEALNAFASTGARRALRARAASRQCGARASRGAREDPGEPSSEERRTVFALLRDLDISLLESATLPNLLALDRRTAEAGVSAPAFEELNDRLCQLFVGWEAVPADQRRETGAPERAPTNAASSHPLARRGRRRGRRVGPARDCGPATMALRFLYRLAPPGRRSSVGVPSLARCGVGPGAGGAGSRGDLRSGRRASLRRSSAGRSRSLQDPRRGGKSSRSDGTAPALRGFRTRRPGSEGAQSGPSEVSCRAPMKRRSRCRRRRLPKPKTSCPKSSTR